jgi:hypothetical protein
LRVFGTSVLSPGRELFHLGRHGRSTAW